MKLPFLKNKLFQDKWLRFKQKKMAYYSLIILLIVGFFSFTAEFWANEKPLYLKYDNQSYYPILKDYHPSIFGIQNEFIMNYRNLTLKEGDFIVWPVINWSPFESNKEVETYPSPPTSKNYFGTDDRGRDVLVRLLYGYRYSITYSIVVWILCLILATIAGGNMGYFGGFIDLVGQRIVEILDTVPLFFLLIIIISIFNPNLWLLIIIGSLFGWISMSYYIRGEFLKNRKKEFVEAARSLGSSNFRIIFKHILPNSMGPIITFSPFIIAQNITALASLDYLGFGLNPPTPSWGELLSQAQQNFNIAWWLAVFPSFALFITLVLLSLVGDGIRDALDPKK